MKLLYDFLLFEVNPCKESSGELEFVKWNNDQ